MEFAEEVREFLIESHENLGVLDREIVELERRPGDEELIASVFRTIHTMKGTCGFFGFEILGSITHVAETVLGQVREGQRALTPELVSLVLESVDAVKRVLASIERCGEEGDDVYQPLRERLEGAGNFSSGPVAVASAAAEASPIDRLPDEAAHAASEAASDGASSGAATASTIRVDGALLDKLMNLVGELVLARNQILQANLDHRGSGRGAAQRLNLITGELQAGVMRARMQPIGVVLDKLPRVVRDLASELGKKIEIQMEGAATELDKAILEAIKGPLTHIVRNCCDHGIETPVVRTAKGKDAVGTILLRACHEGGHIAIEISDDGAGIDPERIKRKAIEKGLVPAGQAAAMSEWEVLRLLFLAGFSTAQKITGISGRGVGMDVVKTNIEKIGGAVDIFTRRGLDGVAAGSTVRIKIPLTLAIIPGLIVHLKGSPAGGGAEPAQQDRFVVPQANLLELVRLEGAEGREQVANIHGARVYRRRGELLPLVFLGRVLGLEPAEPDSAADVLNIVIVQAQGTVFGLAVDGVGDTQEIVVKALSRQLRELSCYVGATIMGDGQVALILDVPGVAKLAGILPETLDRARSAARVVETVEDAREALLLFSAGRFPRLAVPLPMVARLEEFPAARVEYAAGRAVVRYRDAILPLVSMSALLGDGGLDPPLYGDFLEVIVFSEEGGNVGLVVDRIIDIVEESIAANRTASSPGLLGSAVIGGRVTDIVDLGALARAAMRRQGACR